MTGIEHCADVHGYFIEHVSEAMRALRVETRTETQQYLVGLLSGFAVSGGQQDLSEPLVHLLQKALNSQGSERVSRMRDLGDLALFICGFFPDSFDRRGLTRGYVVGMGGRAYLLVSEQVKDRGRGELFVELGGRFHDMARVLDEVRERTALCTDGALVRLYQRWCASGSPTLFGRLRRRGVHAMRPKRGLLH